MRLLRKNKDKLVFHLGKKEQPVFRAVLGRYPLIPSAHQTLSKQPLSPEQETNQRLLDESLAEQRQENKRQLQALLDDPQRFKETPTGWHMTLSGPDVEWLLQVFNDIRVGAWILLGSPEMDLGDFKLNETTAPHAWTMEMAGYFEMHLLEALEGGEG